MSDGTYNKPIRDTHPEAPASGRVKEYVYNENGIPTPYFIGSDNIPRTLKGNPGQDGQDGAQGLQGAKGDKGDKGDTGSQGPSGPMKVEALIHYPNQVTLPNVVSPTLIYSDVINFSGQGNAFLDMSLSLSSYSTSRDIFFYVNFDGVDLSPVYVEEHQDSSTAQSNWRGQTFNLGLVSQGSHTLRLYFKKEDDGGTALLKNYISKVVRYT